MARLFATAFCVTLLTCSLWAGNGAMVISSAPSTVSELSVSKNRLEGTGATLSQILKQLVSEPVRVPTELSAERFDVLLTADSERSLLDAFIAVAKETGIVITRANELSPTVVLRPGTRWGERLPTYASHVPRSHFSCPHCGTAELKRALERSLMQRVVFEPDGLTFSNVKLEWVDDTSLATGLRENLGLQLSREQRPSPIWTVSNQR